MTFTWGSLPSSVELVAVRVTLWDSEQTVLEQLTCTAVPSARSLTVRASGFTQLSAAPWAGVQLSTITQSGARISTNYDSEVLGVYTQFGVVGLNLIQQIHLFHAGPNRMIRSKTKNRLDFRLGRSVARGTA